MRSFFLFDSSGRCLLALAVSLCGFASPVLEASQAARQEALLQQPPRKVVVATASIWLGRQIGSEQRVAAIERLLAAAADEAARRYDGAGLDLFVLPETTLQKGGDSNAPASRRALRLSDEPVRQVAALAARHKVWLVLPMLLTEDDDGKEVHRNAAVLLDRGGQVAGIYRKIHVLADREGVFEKGVSPGREAPVFTTDFGRVGFQICWDIAYDAGWDELAAGGAELVVVPSMSPQTIPLAWYARRHRYWIVSSAPRDNSTVFNPIGFADARITDPGVLVHRFDLVSATVHWNPVIEEGRAFHRRFGDRGGYNWSAREDTGLFWSNDPATPVGAMLKELGVETMDAQVERIGAALERLAD